jgi:mono/diheme cytochrome c family protein
MTRAAFLFALPVLLAAQDRGAKIFQQSCAVGYCHGSGGSANRAPRLAGRGFEPGYVQKVVETGIPNTAMPAFKGHIPDSDLIAVVNYVLSLPGNGGFVKSAAAATSSGTAGPEMSAEAKRGKELFFDPVRSINRCATCHSVDGMGVAIGPNLAAAPPRNSAAIRSIQARDIQTASAGGDNFPALVLEKTNNSTRIFDLTTPAPVLRTFTAGQVTLTSGSWSHADAIASYSATELDVIANYLTWLSKR